MLCNYTLVVIAILIHVSSSYIHNLKVDVSIIYYSQVKINGDLCCFVNETHFQSVLDENGCDLFTKSEKIIYKLTNICMDDEHVLKMKGIHLYMYKYMCVY